MKDTWRKTRSILLAHVLHTDDTPHSIALGAALAVLVAFTPTIPFHTVLAVTLAALLGANKAVCVPAVWVVNPVTAVPIWGACWAVGRALTRTLTQAANGGNGERMSAVLTKLTSAHAGGGFWSHLFEAAFWTRIFGMMFEFGIELWVGGVLLGSAAGCITYLVTRWGVTEYRQRRRVARIYRNIHRARLRKAKHARRLQVDRLAPSADHA